ncbi:MAG: hypothetical protein Fur0046_32580 [Cyanobacteria bacterium J069]|nr:MAG: hypothetical protein D6742_15310 [Cyanobacteria bacterium J069]
MRNTHPDYSWLFRFAVRVLKYFLLALFGILVGIVLSKVLVISLLTHILVGILDAVLFKAMGMVFCLMAIAVVVESIR